MDNERLQRMKASLEAYRTQKQNGVPATSTAQANIGEVNNERLQQMKASLDTYRTSKATSSVPQAESPGIVKQMLGSITKPFEKLSATAQKYGGGAVAYGLDKLTPSRQTYTSFKDATEKVGSGYDTGSFSATKALTGETPKPVTGMRDLVGTSLEAASIVAPVVKAPAFLGKIAKGKVGQAALEGMTTAGLASFGSGTGRGLQSGKDAVGAVEQGVQEGIVGGLFGLGLGGLGGALGKLPTMATKGGRQQMILETAKEQFSKDLDEVLNFNKSLTKEATNLEKNGVPIREILNDTEIAQGIKVANKAINVDDAVAVTQKNLDRAQNAKAKLLPEIDKFAPKVSKEEIRVEAIKDIIGKETNLDEKGLVQRINAQIDALDDNLSLSQIDAERRKFYNSGRTAKGEQRGDSEYTAIENALRKILFDKTDNLPQGIDTNGEIRGLNTYIRQQLKAQDFLDKKLRGQVVKGGRLGEYFARGIGAVAGSQGGVLGSLAGSEIAGYVSNILANNKLASSIKMRLIQNAAEETADPQIIKAANELIKKLQSKPQLQLPAASTGFRSVVPGQNTIQLGANSTDEKIAQNVRRQMPIINGRLALPPASKGTINGETIRLRGNITDELPAQVINRSQSTPSISRQNTANTIMTTNANASIPKNIPQLPKTPAKLSTDLLTEAKKYKSAEEFLKTFDSKKLRQYLNETGEEVGAKTASARAIGSKTRKEGDYLYAQDRGYFDAMLSDIQNGRNLTSGTPKELIDIWKQAQGKLPAKPPKLSK